MIAVTLDVAAARRQLQNFGTIPFIPSDIVEFRMVPSLRSTWHRASDLPDEAASLLLANSCGENIYIGVNPRRARGLRKDESVDLSRCIVADFDHITLEESRMRCESAGMPPASMINSTGHGFHFYWGLTQAITDMVAWTQFQKRLIKAVGSDPAIHNPERIMRLPGFLNMKGSPVLSELVECNAGRRYAIAELGRILPALAPPPERTKYSGSNYAPAGDTVAHWVAKAINRAGRGDRNNTGFWLAKQLNDARVSRADAELGLLDYQRHVTDASDPYTEQEALASLRSAFSAAPREPARRQGPAPAKGSRKRTLAVDTSRAIRVPPTELSEPVRPVFTITSTLRKAEAK